MNGVSEGLIHFNHPSFQTVSSKCAAKQYFIFHIYEAFEAAKTGSDQTVLAFHAKCICLLRIK